MWKGMSMQSYTITSEMAGYRNKQMPKRILLIVVSIVAAEILSIQWHARSGEHLKLGSFVEAVISGVVVALLTELCEAGRNFPYT
jgi:Na+/glutamate symporter